MKRLVVCVAGALAACGSSGAKPPAIELGTIGPLSGDAGKGSFRFGAATAATQIEDMNPNTDWYVWTGPAPTGMAKDTFIANAVDGYTMDLSDVQLVHDMGLDSYRFSIEWARIEPQQGMIDDNAIQHYRDELTMLASLGIRPVVTIHHFSNPIWVADPRDSACAAGPTATNLCGLGSAGGPQIIAAMAAHAGLLASRLGDLVDEWGTENEPVNYLVASYAVGIFPPGKVALASIVQDFAPVARDYLAAHAAMYDAIKQNDTVDADGDGIAANVGLTLSVQDWEPARHNLPSTDPDDLAARDRIVYLFHWLYIDSIVNGTYDSDFDGTPDEQHPEWKGKLDWLGLQYYFRAGVTASPALFPVPVSLTPCTFGSDLGSCLPADNKTFCVPQMGYEFWPDGVRTVLEAFSARYPTLPLVVTESGIATDVGARRSEQIVRVLEAIAKAQQEENVDVRGFYEWSLTDNFEWANGFAPHFGLYSVDDTTYARTPTDAATVLGAIAQTREVTSDQREKYGGSGVMTPDSIASDQFCSPLAQ
ncbi:MAG TPA: family 1 glycosylhydrolase [Kofleriaceae bacterium]|nr:family 1 glycosylhydrolase [Kofleriaceae bacterium]